MSSHIVRPMINPTMEKFGYPQTLVREYEHWVVLVRPRQITVGSLALVCKGDVRTLSTVMPEAYSELHKVTTDIEAALHAAFQFDKINYLLLMMVDKQVHWHVLPRYATARTACGSVFLDRAWPEPPDMGDIVILSAQQLAQLTELIKSKWPRPR